MLGRFFILHAYSKTVLCQYVHRLSVDCMRPGCRFGVNIIASHYHKLVMNFVRERFWVWCADQWFWIEFMVRPRWEWEWQTTTSMVTWCRIHIHQLLDAVIISLCVCLIAIRPSASSWSCVEFTYMCLDRQKSNLISVHPVRNMLLCLCVCAGVSIIPLTITSIQFARHIRTCSRPICILAQRSSLWCP